MKLNVSQQLKLPGIAGTAHIVEPIKSIDFGGRIVEFASPADITAEYVYDGKGFTVDGSFSALLSSVCARCDENFDEPFSFDFSERFVKEVSDADEEMYTYNGDTIDLSVMIQDNILLNLPMRSLCREECKGKCPRCGCNLNLTRCSCECSDVDSDESASKGPFAGLMKLLTDDKEV